MIFRDFDDVLKNPFRYVDLFLLHTLLSKKKFQKSPCKTCNRGSKVAVQHPPSLNEGLALINPVFCPTSSTNQKHLKLGQCLEIDDRRSLSKYGDVTWPNSHFTTQFAFYRSVLYTLVCRIINFSDIELKFAESISDVRIGSAAKLYQVIISRSYSSIYEIFERFWTSLTSNLETRWVLSNFLQIPCIPLKLDN